MSDVIGGRRNFDLNAVPEQKETNLKKDEKKTKKKTLQSLKARDHNIDLTSQVGKYTLITDATPESQRGGYYCSICECQLKDSQSYLDHIDGRRHQQAMGMSMKPEIAGIDKVRSRLEYYTTHKDEVQDPELIAAERLRKLDREDIMRKKMKKSIIKSRNEVKEEEILDSEKYEMKALGFDFVNFGSSKK